MPAQVAHEFHLIIGWPAMVVVTATWSNKSHSNKFDNNNNSSRRYQVLHAKAAGSRQEQMATR